MESDNSVSSTITDQIVQYSDPDRIALSNWYYPTSMKVYGLKSADLKKIISETKKDIMLSYPDSLVSISLELAQNGVFECQLVAFGLLNRNFKLLSSLSYTEIMNLGAFMDNWVSTDSFSTQIAGPAWRLGCIKDEEIVSWARSEDRWWRRNALVATVGLNLKSQGGSGDARRTLMICEMLVQDRDDMVVKAMSWALRELSKREREAVENFLSTYSDSLAPRAKRELRRKLTTGRKNG